MIQKTWGPHSFRKHAPRGKDFDKTEGEQYSIFTHPQERSHDTDGAAVGDNEHGFKVETGLTTKQKGCLPFKLS